MTQSGEDWRSMLHSRGFPAVKVPGANSNPITKDQECGAVRTILAGGHLLQLINHESVTPLERVWRKNPLPGAFTATPEAPFAFELGALDIPNSMVLVLLDYRFAIYEPSGVVAGDSHEIRGRRLSTSVGYELLFNEKRPDNVIYDLTPSNPSTATQTYQAEQDNGGIIPGQGLTPPTQATFNQLRATNTRSSTASASSTLPQRHRRDAQLEMPFTYIVDSNQRVNLRVIIFQGIPIPIDFFEGEISGMLMPSPALHAFIKEVVPCKS